MKGLRCKGAADRRSGACRAVKTNWRETAKPIQPGSTYPAKQYCSHCGLCDTYYVAHVKDACAFLGEGGAPVLWLPEFLCQAEARAAQAGDQLASTIPYHRGENCARVSYMMPFKPWCCSIAVRMCTVGCICILHPTGHDHASVGQCSSWPRSALEMLLI
jgi:hypothetical protein